GRRPARGGSDRRGAARARGSRSRRRPRRRGARAGARIRHRRRGRRRAGGARAARAGFPRCVMRITSGIDWSAPTYEECARRHRWSVPERLNIADIACDRHADGKGHLALLLLDQRGTLKDYTFDDLKALSDRLAGGLASIGVERGDRVAVYL